MDNSERFLIKSYMNLLKYIEDQDERCRIISIVENLLDNYENKIPFVKKPSPAIDAVKDFIVKNMPEGKRESKEMENLCRANGFSVATVKRAKKMLGIKSVKEGKGFTDATWYWEL